MRDFTAGLVSGIFIIVCSLVVAIVSVSLKVDENRAAIEDQTKAILLIKKDLDEVLNKRTSPMYQQRISE